MARVLIADDDRDTRELVKQMLAGQGYQFIQSADGDSAYNMAVSVIPDIIILDIGMPVTGGFDVLRKLKENPDTEAIPVLILTGRLSPKNESEAGKLGAADFITKPFSKDELSGRVRMALAQ